MLDNGDTAGGHTCRESADGEEARLVGVIDDYMTALEGALRGPRRAKADLLAEVRDGLTDAAAAHERTGLGRQASQRQAVQEFGAVGEIAPGYQAELGLAQGLRTALLVLSVLAAQPLAWGMAGPLVARVLALPWVSRPGPGYALADQAVEVLGVAAVVGGLLAALGCGIGIRFLRASHLTAGRRLARVTGVFALAVALVFALLGVFLSAVSAEARSTLNPPGVLWTVAFLLLPMGWVALSGRRCLSSSQAPGLVAARRR